MAALLSALAAAGFVCITVLALNRSEYTAAMVILVGVLIGSLIVRFPTER